MKGWIQRHIERVSYGLFDTLGLLEGMGEKEGIEGLGVSLVARFASPYGAWLPSKFGLVTYVTLQRTQVTW